jgi:hypothetical protein
MSTLGLTIACVLGAAVMVGAGKLVFDLQKNKLPPPRRKKPWELD